MKRFRFSLPLIAVSGVGYSVRSSVVIGRFLFLGREKVERRFGYWDDGKTPTHQHVLESGTTITI